MAHKQAISSTKKSTHPEPKATESNVITAATVKQNLPLIAALTAEFIGTFLLIASVFTVQGQPLFVSFALIGILLVVSGSTNVYLNPAMTIGALVTKKVGPLHAIGQIMAQLLGAAAAYFALTAFMAGTPATSATTATTTHLFHAASITAGKEWYIFFAELLGSSILALGVSAALKAKDRIVAASTYGLAILVAILIAGSATAIYLTESNTTLTFLNPATAIAANAVTWGIWPIASYLIAPVIGAIIGFGLRDLLSSQKKDKQTV